MHKNMINESGEDREQKSRSPKVATSCTTRQQGITKIGYKSPLLGYWDTSALPGMQVTKKKRSLEQSAEPENDSASASSTDVQPKKKRKVNRWDKNSPIVKGPVLQGDSSTATTCTTNAKRSVKKPKVSRWDRKSPMVRAALESGSTATTTTEPLRKKLKADQLNRRSLALKNPAVETDSATTGANSISEQLRAKYRASRWDKRSPMAMNSSARSNTTITEQLKEKYYKVNRRDKSSPAVKSSAPMKYSATICSTFEELRKKLKFNRCAKKSPMAPGSESENNHPTTSTAHADDSGKKRKVNVHRGQHPRVASSQSSPRVKSHHVKKNKKSWKLKCKERGGNPASTTMEKPKLGYWLKIGSWNQKFITTDMTRTVTQDVIDLTVDMDNTSYVNLTNVGSYSVGNTRTIPSHSSASNQMAINNNPDVSIIIHDDSCTPLDRESVIVAPDKKSSPSKSSKITPEATEVGGGDVILIDDSVVDLQRVSSPRKAKAKTPSPLKTNVAKASKSSPVGSQDVDDSLIILEEHLKERVNDQESVVRVGSPDITILCQKRKLFPEQAAPIRDRDVMQAGINKRINTMVNTHTNNLMEPYQQLFSVCKQAAVQQWRPSGQSQPLIHQPSSSRMFGNNYSTPPRRTDVGLRPVIIDGSNVAMGHGGGTGRFSSRGLRICIDFFLKKNHKVYAFVPLYRRKDPDTLDQHILDQLEKSRHLIFTPSRYVDGRRIVPYDDRYIVQTAAELGGVIVSKDNYNDLLHENPNYSEVIKKRLLMFTWIEDMIMFPPDPLGKDGPTLDQFLRF